MSPISCSVNFRFQSKIETEAVKYVTNSLGRPRTKSDDTEFEFFAELFVPRLLLLLGSSQEQKEPLTTSRKGF